MKRETINRILKFTADRDWDQFHSPANLAKSISIEANELLECFQWDEEHYNLDDVKDELGKTRDGSLSCRIENASKTENRPLSCSSKR